MRKVILVVEDESEIRRDLVMTLKLSDYDAIGADNGITGLEKAVKHKPDLIISDIMMPEMDGYQFLTELQKNQELAVIPFLFLSAKSDIREGMNLGADDFITKPYDIDELLEAVRTRIKKSEVSETRYLKKFEELSTRISRSLPHEIRTPLGIILGYSDHLIKTIDSSDPEESKEMLKNIYESGRRLNRLFENHLFYAKLETISSNEREIEKLKEAVTISVDMYISDMVNYIVGNSGRRHDLQVHLESANIAMSETYLTKIMEEVVDNCLKFSKKGSPILIESELVIDKYRLNFTDYGRGMAAKQVDKVGAYIQFERQIYEQQGSGLGLAIVKKIVELHGGSFSIDSVPDNYTNVVIDIPINNSPAGNIL